MYVTVSYSCTLYMYVSGLVHALYSPNRARNIALSRSTRKMRKCLGAPLGSFAINSDIGATRQRLRDQAMALVTFAGMLRDVPSEVSET